MKKFWIINIGKNPSNKTIRYVLSLLNFYNPMIYLEKSDKIIFSVEDIGKNNQFGWGKLEHYDWFINNDYKFSGNISLRKEKLKKINEKYK